MAWVGPPKWNGKTHDLSEFRTLHYPCAIVTIDGKRYGAPLIVMLEGTEDKFVPCFTDVEALHKHVGYLSKHLGLDNNYCVDTITEDTMVPWCRAMKAENIRIMMNPQVIDAHHTKWVEIIEENDMIKFFDAERN